MAGLLLDHLWQSTLFALAAALVALALRRHRAEVRFWVWFAAGAKFLVPFVLITSAVAGLAAHLHAQAPAPPRLELAAHVLAPITTHASIAMARPIARAAFDLGPYALAAWTLGAGAILAWRIAQWRALKRALAASAPLALPVPLPAVVASGRGGPAVAGFLRPVLMLPEGLAERLTPAELEAVLEHELQHARRRDNLLTLPLLLAEALFWPHPLIWWIGRRLTAEREQSCDEAVIGEGIDAETYARGLLQACRLALEPAPALSAAVGGADLQRRIRRIMGERAPRPLGALGGALLTAAAGAALAAPVLPGVFATAPDVAARALTRLVLPGAPARPPRPQPPRPAPEAKAHRRMAERAPARIALLSPPAPAEPLAETLPAPQPIHLARRLAAPEFQPEPPAVSPTPILDAAPPPPDSDLARALANRTAHVRGADFGGARLDLRSLRACPTAGVIDAERRLGGQAVSTAFDGRVRRFVDGALAGRAPARDLSPAMAQAVDRHLPMLQAALATRFGAPGDARLIGEDSRDRDLYLVRVEGAGPSGAGYVLVMVDDLGQIQAAVFCVAG